MASSQEEWIEGQRMYSESFGHREVSAQELEVLTVLLPILRGFSTIDELRRHYEIGRGALIQLVQDSISPSLRMNLELGRARKMAYGLRYNEICTGKLTRRLDWKEDPRFDQAVRRALSEMQEMAVRLRHNRLTIYHLLWALLKSSSGIPENPPFARLLQITTDYVRTIPAAPFQQYSPAHTIGDDIKQTLDFAYEEAKRRGLIRVRLPLMLYATIKSHASELQRLGDSTLRLGDLEAELEHQLSDTTTPPPKV